MAISIEDIKRLRELTGVGMTDAKQALDAASGDFDIALKEMRKKGLTKAEKRGEREARQGLVGTYNHDGRIGVIVEVNCETDFVARNQIFLDLVKDVAMHVAASNPQYVSSNDIPAEDREAKKQELLASDALKSKPADMAEKIVEGQLGKYFADLCLLDQPFIKNPDQTVGQYVTDHNARLGENIVVRRFNRIALGEK
ncbi:elongation factor Ts [Candidatus Saccharibacteria bacterium]|nr:MAG: elongation factor Ts [Candidatus Saccharibacteria bacterium]